MPIDTQSHITFYTEGTVATIPLQDLELVQQWLTALATRHHAEVLSLTFILADDEYILQVNKDYLSHDYYTDVITFPYREGDELEADIFISVDRVKDNAAQRGEPYLRELRRVMAHGILHLLGYRDKTADDQLAMRLAEDEALAHYDELAI